MATSTIEYPSQFRTIYDALNFLYKISFILGYSGFYKKGRQYQSTSGMLAYNILMPIVVVTGVIYAIYLKLRKPEDQELFFHKMDTLLISIAMMLIFLASLAYCINIGTMQYHRWRHIHLIDHIDQLDTCLMREFKVQMGYEKLAYKTSTILTLFFLYYIIVIVALISHWQMGDLAAVIGLVCCYSLMISGMQVGIYGYMTVADVTRIRFRLLQKLLAPTYLRKHFANIEVRTSKLRQAIEIYQGLYDVIDELNNVYGLCLLSCLVHDFALTTSQLYLMFGRSSNLGSYENIRLFIGVMSFLLPSAYKMVMMPVYTTMSMDEGKNCMRAIKLMDDAFPGDNRVRKIVEATLLWNKFNKVEYKIGHTITCNVGMMAAVFSAIVNYIVIMIQFQIQEEAVNKEMEKQKQLF